RRRAPPPADVPHGGGTRGLAARPADGPRAARALQRAPHPGPARAAAARGARRRALDAALLARPERLGRSMTVDMHSKVREVPDFPTPGVGFKDVTPLLADPVTLRQTVDALADWVKEKRPDLVLGAEARGFWLGAAVAVEAGV